SMSIFLGDGVGALGPKTDLPIAGSPIRLFAADMNGDGAVDAVVQLASGPGLFVLLGDHAGGFVAGGSASLPSTTTQLDALGDVNGDAKPDAVATTPLQTLHVLLGDGLGGFAAPIASALHTTGTTSLSSAGDAAIGDFDGDGRVDYAVAFANTEGVFTANGGVQTYAGDGAGGAVFAASQTLLASSFTAPAVHAAPDLNGDGRPDVLTLNGGTFRSFLSGPGGSLLATVTVPDTFSRFAALGDFDADGLVDAAISDDAASLVSVLANRGPKGPAPDGIAVEGGPFRAAVGDLDGDGILDLVVTNGAGGGSVSQLQGTGGAAFAPPIAIGLVASSTALALGDLNLDGDLDLVVGSFSTAAVSVFLGGPGGGFGAPSTFATAGGGVGRVALADVNGDGIADLVATKAGFGVSSVSILAGTGSGGFGAFTSFNSLPASIGGLALVDFNHDGKLDIATTFPDLNDGAVHLGAGSGAFGGPIPFFPGPTPTTLARVDWNGDANADLAVCLDNGTFAVLPGNGAGGFAPKVVVPAGVFAADLIAADLDGDGHVDFALSDLSTKSLSVVRTNGAGGAIAPKLYTPSVGTAGNLVFADLDSDGRLDVVAMRFPSGYLTVHRNETPEPAGIAPFGSGTPGCAGGHGVSATASAAPGQDLDVVCTNAPANALGLALEADAADIAGTDLLGLALLFHLDLFAATSVNAWDLHSDAFGFAHGSAAIPNSPSLTGVSIYVQCLWYWPACSPASPSHLSSSKGLAVTFQ
ncbi:MAG TPA: VCBS repeat-containing protein, partial [Planctomycetota bacterium]|nr:VCBS repeat-containing protein [Planctomycetota bacterium]